MNKTYLKGLNSLRFFAAAFVIISHGQQSVSKLGFARFSDMTLFNRGGDAVEFFYVLSGFLITYLLQGELSQTGTVSIRSFYMRRVYRIWPLYFLIVALGFGFLSVIYPRMTGQQFFDFPIWKGLVLFFCFLPNLATSLYTTGLLFPLRTIGVEEQFYLFWAPVIKKFRNKLSYLIGGFIVISYVWYAIVIYGNIPFSETVLAFLKTQKFYAMATGAGFGLIQYKYGERYMRSLLSSRTMQWLVIAVIVYYYLVGFTFMDETLIHFCMCGIYGLLIMNSNLIDRPVINLERRPLVFLGTISYGLYMCHMLVDYTLRFTLMRLHIEKAGYFMVMMPLYHIVLMGGAIVVASFSYKHYENFFLRVGKGQQTYLHRLKNRYA
jgi:peptidoglycan/LPS O-acetylase OafA/YrhL